MRIVIVYESMYGNTHLVADAIGAGLEPAADVIVVRFPRRIQSCCMTPLWSWSAGRRTHTA